MAISKRIGKPIACFHTVEYYLAVKRNNCSATWINLTNIVLSEKKARHKKNTYLYDSIYMMTKNWQSQSIDDRKQKENVPRGDGRGCDGGEN